MVYQTLVIDPLREMTSLVFSFVPPIVTAFCLLILGCIIVKFIERLIVSFLTTIKFDTLSERLGLVRILETGDIRRKPSHLFASFAYLVLMMMVLIVTVRAMGLPITTNVVDRLLLYIPNVITGVLVLIIGMLMAKLISGIIFVIAKNTDMPVPTTLARLSKWVILVYVTILFLTEIGFIALFAGETYTIFIGGFIFALALAFGLAGRDIAAKYLEVFKRSGA
ncbi:MAG: hypothetical protein Q7S13_00625 [Candidatus Omnitrophota bacterium]|nr:hypothetical protein [Candidatus Omnitrophota bacterium]